MYAVGRYFRNDSYLQEESLRLVILDQSVIVLAAILRPGGVIG